MLGLGFWEIAVIGVLLLVVVGPERLPHVMRWAGRTYGMVRRTADELRRAFVLEADRQDAEERLKELRERQRRAREEADRVAREQPDAAPQARHLPTPPDPGSAGEEGT
jgi:sec-independent protein translocase protein TatB